jgi:hypothetical protein
MLTPPIISGTPYTSIPGSDLRQNVVTSAVSVNTAYLDNVLPGETGTPLADKTISVFPALTYLRSSPRQEENLNYSPGFTFYFPTSVLDGINQSAAGSFEGRLSPNATLDLQENFVRTSNVFDVSYPFSSGGLSGSTTTPIPAAIVPFVEQMRNVSNAALTYQFSRNGMIGGSGTSIEFRTPNQAGISGLFNSNGYGGSAFYSRRATRRQYLGIRYEYDWVSGFGGGTQVGSQTHSLLPFYTVFFSRTFSLSAAAGSAYTEITQPQQPTITRWNAIAVLSMGWQGEKGNLSSSFLRTAISGTGLIGAYNSVSANFASGWKLSRTWNANVSFTYQNIEPVAPLAIIIYQGGNSLMAQGALKRTWGERFAMEFGYQRLHQEFPKIAAIEADPDSDRVFLNATYSFKKSLGR